MANEKTRESFGKVRAVPVREGETWKQYIDRLRGDQTLGASHMAGIMAATVLMGKEPNAPARGRMLDALTERLTKQSSFRQLARDPEALRLTRGGKGADLIVRMGEKKRLEDEARRRYQRSSAQVRDDARFYQAAMKSMKDNFAAQSPAQRERESRRFLEMVKRLDHARSLSEQGIPLDGKTARELAQAVQQYNDGGSRIPGGKQEAAASREALCVLQHVMPEEDFNSYCASINQAHQAHSPAHRRHVNPADYGEALLNGSSRTAKDLMLDTQLQLNRGLTLEGCATATAVMTLSGGNPNAIIRQDALDAEVKKLQQPGSAFLRAMSDDASRGKYAQLASEGKVASMSRSIIRDAKEHSIRTAQWKINQSVKSMGKDGGATADHLAEILAAREIAAQSGPGQRITNGEFKVKAQQIKSSPEFAGLADRYQKDPMLRERIDRGLSKGDGGKALEQEYQKVKAPQKDKITKLQQPVLKTDAQG